MSFTHDCEVMNGKTIALDGLAIQVEADGEGIPVPWSPEPAFKYRVSITAEDGYVHATHFFHAPPDRPLHDDHGNRDPNSKRDYDGVAWVVLDVLSTAARDPRFGERTPEQNEFENQWPSWRREQDAYLTATIAAAKRLAPLLERNAATIIEGSEQVDWW